MKRIYFLLVVLLVSSMAVAQKTHILVSRDGDVVPMKKGESVLKAINEYIRQRKIVDAAQVACANPIQFGFDPDHYSVDNSSFQTFHKDIIAVNLASPADGTMDTIYVLIGTSLNVDSQLTVRIMDSRIYPGNGPGYGPFTVYLPGDSLYINGRDSGGVGPTNYGSPLCWGYFTNTNDLDGQANNPEGGVAAFPEDATPADSTAWVSTMQRQFPHAPGTFPPTGDEIWGAGGYPFKHLKASAINVLNLHKLPPAPSFHAGQPIMLTFQIPGPHFTAGSTDDPAYTIWHTHTVSPDPDHLYRHTHDWKWYEHASSCGIPGWVDRGLWEFMIWYSISVSGNTPPHVLDITHLGATASAASRNVTVHMEDCNFAHPESAGVAWAHMAYSVDGGPYQMLPLNYLGGTTYNGQIPAVAALTGQPYSRTVTWYVAAADNQGLVMDSSLTYSYEVLSWGNQWYRPDTSVACIPVSIEDTPGSHYLDTTSTLGSSLHPTWFYPPYSNSNKAPKDDGSAGPFDLGGPFVYFGDTVRYAWITVNGAIALSATATDTIDVSDNGYYTDWDFPSAEHLGRGDTAGAGNVPRNFIGALWYDLYYVDTGSVQSGRIFWKSDSCRFIAEYDSIGEEYDGAEVPGPPSIYVPYAATFRVVLNRCDGTFDIQWDNVQEGFALDTISSVAFQGNNGRIIRPATVATEVGSNPGWYKFYRGTDNGPMNLKPRDGWCVRFHPFVGTAVASGWNMVSVPTVVPDSNYSKTHLYSDANSQAFGYNGGYVQSGTLLPGVGYWLKFPATSGYETPGDPRLTFIDSVKTDWNMVGSIGRPVYVSSVVQTPSAIVSSPYYGYRKGYYIATTLDPGRGYWVKSKSLGALQLTTTPIPKLSPEATPDFSVMNMLTFSDADGYRQPLYIGSETDLKASASMYELPPPAPAGVFDARFASQRMVETYPDNIQGGKVYEYPISVQTSSYPVTIQWQIQNTNGHTLSLTDGIGGRVLNNAVLNNTGSIKITNPSVKSFVLRFAEGRPLPKEFALSQNYPNPFNPTTRFNVDVPKTTDVEIVVYNILGQKIATLLSGMQWPGYHTIEWDGRDVRGLVVPSGMYFVRMTADEFSSVRKVMMLK